MVVSDHVLEGLILMKAHVCCWFGARGSDVSEMVAPGPPPSGVTGASP